MKAESGKRKAHSRDLTDRRSESVRQNAKGMTLFEVLLVLILLVVLGSFATPILDGTLASVRLRRGTDKVLADWAKARTKAIEKGQVFRFRFSVNSNEYRIDRWQADESFQESEQSGTTENSSEMYESAATDEFFDSPDEGGKDIDERESASDWQIEGKLSETVVFVGGEQAVVDATGSREVETLEDEDSAEWSAPILFFPDGTTSEASILLRNEKELYQRATLRALTGAARASRLLTATEVDDQQSR